MRMSSTAGPARPAAFPFAFLSALLIGAFLVVAAGMQAAAAPYAAMVMDARTGKVLHARNADTPLHPASLTKMMTLYIAFEAIENGEIDVDQKVLISRKAAAEVPSKLGLRAGQRIELRYLIRAAALKSANDAATAIGEAIEGSEAAFARRMNRTARAMGMERTNFKNAHGLTEEGHLSTARDMTILGRHLFYDYPEYYNLFSRISTDAKLATVYHTNRKFLRDYSGADGIKTGYTRAAGFNLTASAERGGKRIIATVFGGNSTASRNAEMARLMDLGFQRAPRYARVRKPAPPAYAGRVAEGRTAGTAGSRLAVVASLRPVGRPVRPEAPAPDAPAMAIAALDTGIADAVAVAAAAAAAIPPDETAEAEDASEAQVAALETETVAPQGAVPDPATEEVAAPVPPAPRQVAFLRSSLVPAPRPDQPPAPRPDGAADEPVVTLAAAPPQPLPDATEVVARASSSGGRHWGVAIGRYPSRFAAERELLKTALAEMATLDGALRKVAPRDGGFAATFLGLSEDQAQLTCRRLAARGAPCETLGPG
jgi:D-alanyl-D-alanine carboxypeptidase